MPHHVRRLTPADQIAAWQLGSIAFGYRDQRMPEGWTSDTPGRRSWGVFDRTDRLLAKAVDREQSHWFGGQVVPACGVAGVAVTPERRRDGLGRLVLTQLLAEARKRGAAVSTLFGTTPVPYRRLGWEEVGALTWTALPTAALADAKASERITLTEARAPRQTTLRPAVESDVFTIDAIYQSVARTRAGMMHRAGPMFPASAADFLAQYHGVTVAVDDQGTVTGYASWDRGQGYDSTSRVTVSDLIGTTPDATSALLAMLGSWTSVAPTLLLRLPEPDPVLLATSTASARVESRRPWMLRIIDAMGAVAARGWPTYLHGSVDLDLVDEVCPWNSGAWRLLLDNGQGSLVRGGKAEVRLSERGLAMWYSGAAGPALLRRTGQLSGGDPRTDEFLLAATAGPAPTLLDYF